MGVVWDLLGRRVKRTALLMSCLSWGNKKREASKKHVVGFSCSTDGLVIEDLRSLSDSRQLLPKANRYCHIICCLAPPQRTAIPIFCKALRDHVQPGAKISPSRQWSQCTQSFHPPISQSR